MTDDAHEFVCRYCGRLDWDDHGPDCPDDEIQALTADLERLKSELADVTRERDDLRARDTGRIGGGGGGVAPGRIGGGGGGASATMEVPPGTVVTKAKR